MVGLVNLCRRMCSLLIKRQGNQQSGLGGGPPGAGGKDDKDKKVPSAHLHIIESDG